ncbi:MAG: hypothetical protein AB8B59_16930 [Maribacter sp.]
MAENGKLSTYWSINILLFQLFAGIFGIKSYLYGSIFYLVMNSILFCGVADSAKKKYQIAIELILGIGITIPILNANGI